jgi:CBS domain-containing protein
MNAADVMTQSVITVTPDTSVVELAKLLVEKNVSAVPVVDGSGALVGIVTEGDLLRRKELASERRHHPIAAFLMSDLALEQEYIQSHGSKASDIMRRHVITAAPTTPLLEIVDLFERHRIKRAPVVENGKLVGIVSRVDLVRALAAIKAAAAPEHVSDRKIRRQLMAELSRQRWSKYHGNNVTVCDGVVHFWGLLSTPAEFDALRVAAERIPGVRGVSDHTVTPPTPVA